MIYLGDIMKNKEMLNICYKFFNRFITASELVDKLGSIDCDETEFISFVNELKEYADKIPNEVDEYVLKQKESIKKMIDKLSQIPKDPDLQALNNHVDSLKKDYEREFDSHERWFKVVEFINDNKYFNECFDSMSKYELLEFIAQYICAPFPPQINEKEFEEIIAEGIKHDEREWIWRMALNYEHSGFDFSLISNYFIEVRDGYYLVELISAVGGVLDIDSVLDKIVDKDLVEDVKSRKDVLENCLSSAQMEKLMNK